MRAASCSSSLPTASRSTLCSLNSAAVEEARDGALVHHGDAVAHADHLLHVAGDHQDRDAARRRGRASARRSRSWRRHRCRGSARRRSSPAGASTATWRARPSAGCRRTGCRPRSRPTGALMPRRVRCRSALAVSAPRRTMPATRVAGEVGQGDVLGDRDVEQQAGALAVLGHQVDAALDRVARRLRSPPAAPSRHDLAAERAVDAEDGPGELGAAGADQPGEAQDLAAAQRQVDRLRRDRPRCARRASSQHGLARRRRRRQIERLEVAADHQADHGGVADLGLGQLADPAAVAQHDDPVGAALDLVQAVGDEDDARRRRP